MPKSKVEPEYTSNNSFMTSQVKIPKPFGNDYEDPLEALKLQSNNTIKELFPNSDEILEPHKENAGLTTLSELTEPIELTDLSAPTELGEPTEPTNLTELGGLTEPYKRVLTQPISPIRDFTKTPNSIGRQVMAKGLFKGKSKQIYDFLWMSSRGSINPSRTVRKTHGEIQNGTGIGSLNTIKNGLKYLDQIGLISKTSAVGEAWGNIYEIFTPEEINLTDTVRPVSSVSLVRPISSISSVSQEMVQPVRPESDRTNLTSSPLVSTNYEQANTSLKTNTKNDDEAFAKLNEIFAKACEKVSGKPPSKNQQRKWAELADLLVMELEVASARTTSVSDVPAFLTEHLRRRLMPAKREAAKKEVPKTKTSKSSQIGKQQPSELIETYQAEPLSEQGRESTKQAFAGYIEKGQKEFLMGLEDSYTKEDWEWLMKELRIA